MSDIAQFREFVSPHNYVYQDCVVRQGVIYQCNNLNGTGGRWIENDWDIFISQGLTEEVNNISELLASTIMAMNDRLNGNSQEITRLNELLAKLIFDLVEQGIKIENKELLQELKTYYCK